MNYKQSSLYGKNSVGGGQGDSVYSKDFQSAVGTERFESATGNEVGGYQQIKGDVKSFRGFQDGNGMKPSLYQNKQSQYQKKSMYGRPSTRSMKESIFGGRRQSNYQSVGGLKSVMASKDHVYLTWHDVKFTVPNKAKPVKEKSARQQLVDRHQQDKQLHYSDMKLNQSETRSQSNLLSSQISTGSNQLGQSQNPYMNQPTLATGKRKEVLHGLTGCALPAQIMCIMGASGSGKTTLLNVLGQRTALSRGGKMTGEVRVNDRIIQTTDFGKFGAFVQQDDVLFETFTPEESLRFACKLRTSLEGPDIDDKVEEILYRLSLVKCRNTRIGGTLFKGLSGGERKRTSIGYELITDPSLLLLDEPTSGLDSTTSLKICKMLAKQAREHQMTIIATIHQPSADLFNTFDRMILLEQGYEVYQGPVKEIPAYWADKLMCPIKRFQNPADFIIKFAQSPAACFSQHTLESISECYQTHLRPAIEKKLLERTQRYNVIDTNFQDFAENRASGFIPQFIQIFIRNTQFLLRNPQQMIASWLQALIMAFMISTVFWHKCPYPDVYSESYNQDGNFKEVNKQQKQFFTSVSGIAFIWSSNITVMAAFGAVLQIPLQVPVMTRELSNKMYHPLAYLFGRLLSQLMIQLIPPLLMFSCTFWAVRIDYDIKNLAWLVAFSIVGDQVWTVMGFWIGLTINDEGDGAKIILVFVCMVLMAVNGGMINPKNANWFIKNLSRATPGRYVMEGYFRCMTYGIDYQAELTGNDTSLPLAQKDALQKTFDTNQADILDQAGYDFSLEKCFGLLYVWLAVWTIGCVISIMLKYGRI